MKTLQWQVKVFRNHNPDRTVVAYGESATAVEASLIKTLRDNYGIWDARAIEVIGQVQNSKSR